MMLIMRNPMDFIDFNLSEFSAFNFKDILEELLLRVHIVSIVLTPQNLEWFEDVVNVCGQNSRTLRNLLNRKQLIVILE